MTVRNFFELIKVALGNKESLDYILSADECQILFEFANKQSLSSFLFQGLEKVYKNAEGKMPNVLIQWFAIQQKTKVKNLLQNTRTRQLTEILKINGFRSCVLKGQGTALYYYHPEYRQCGDIDIWVEGGRNDILDFARKQMLQIGHIDIKHSDISFFSDVPVEVHFIPSWMYSPFTNKKLRHFFQEKAEKQFANVDDQLGFAHTTIEFDLVYSIVHIYRHIFSEGIGLRQLVDYYYILIHSSKEQRNDAFNTLQSLKMKSFVGGIMWILKDCFGMEELYLLCPTNEKHGKFLLSEILTAGNFGHYDNRMRCVDRNRRFQRGLVQFKKNLRFVSYYPSEVLWSPFWKVWHWCWRKHKGYL